MFIKKTRVHRVGFFVTAASPVHRQFIAFSSLGARGGDGELMRGDVEKQVEVNGGGIAGWLARWQAGVEMVYAVRETRADETAGKRWGTKLFYSLLAGSRGVKVPPDAGDFRLMDRAVVDALRQLPERNRFMKGLYAWVGFKSVAIPFVPADRLSGTSSFRLRNLIKLALSGLTSFSTLPLRVWTIVGVLISMAAITYGIYVVFDTLINGNPTSGWPTITVALMLFSGVQLLSIGILGEYIGRIFTEVKQRPLYLISKDHDNSQLDR
jgi:glycosyltransferase involved in cell wall biosynthesis